MPHKNWHDRNGLNWTENVKMLVLMYLENDFQASAYTAVSAWEMMQTWPKPETMYDLLDCAERAMIQVCTPEDL